MNAEFFVAGVLLIGLVLALATRRGRTLLIAGLKMMLIWICHFLVGCLTALFNALWQKERAGGARLNPPRQRYWR